jgi:hypothetical protein
VHVIAPTQATVHRVGKQKEDVSNAAVDEGHGAHNARLVRHIKVQIIGQIRSRMVDVPRLALRLVSRAALFSAANAYCVFFVQLTLFVRRCELLQRVHYRMLHHNVRLLLRALLRLPSRSLWYRFIIHLRVSLRLLLPLRQSRRRWSCSCRWWFSCHGSSHHDMATVRCRGNRVIHRHRSALRARCEDCVGGRINHDCHNVQQVVCTSHFSVFSRADKSGALREHLGGS